MESAVHDIENGEGKIYWETLTDEELLIIIAEAATEQYKRWRKKNG